MPGPEEQSTRPVALALRESFIAYFQLPGQETALRLLDELAYHSVCEVRGDYLMPREREPGAPDPITRTDVLAAAGDLRQAADQLKESAQALAEIGSEDREVMRIALAVADTSAAVQPLADALDAALAHFLANEPPEEEE